jgi:hypothetical protein
MNLPDHIKHRAMSATQSKETAAMLRGVQKGGSPGIAQQVLGEAAKNISTTAAQVGWLPLAGLTLLYASRIMERDHNAGKQHKNKFLGIDL